MRMLTFYINRAGKNLPEERQKALKKAKTILSGIIADEKEKSAAKKSSAKKSATKKASRKTSKAATVRTIKTPKNAV